MSTIPKINEYGDVMWRGHFDMNHPAKVTNHRDGRTTRKPYMVYEMVGINDRKHYYDHVDGLQVTNGTCQGKGWDIVLFGEIVHHEADKRDAQREAETLVRGSR